MKGFHLKRTAGFSLLELMVVVAIIGVLAAVAVPRFNIFRARARQAEAKSNLGVIFTLQEAFKIDKEFYYDGDGGSWGGSDMNALAEAEGYVVTTTTTRGTNPGRPRCSQPNPPPRMCGSTTTAGAARCRNNKLGFRLANCDAARYGYYIAAAGETEFVAYAFAPSDEAKRIFPGCDGATRENTTSLPSGSQSGKPQCANDVDGTTVAAVDGTGGDAFCLDHNRVVDNLIDIVGSQDCTN